MSDRSAGMLVASTGRGLLRRNASAGDQMRATHVKCDIVHMFDVMFCCLPARVGDEVDEVVRLAGYADTGATGTAEITGSGTTTM